MSKLKSHELDEIFEKYYLEEQADLEEPAFNFNEEQTDSAIIKH